jgi:ribosomal protein S18 acetylase RimI-like enzyme
MPTTAPPTILRMRARLRQEPARTPAPRARGRVWPLARTPRALGGGGIRIVRSTRTRSQWRFARALRQPSHVTEILVLSPDEWALWRRLRLAALTEAPYAFGARLKDWQGDADAEQRWRSRLSIPGSHNVAAMVSDQPVGMASGVPTSQTDVVELISMWVTPTARGRGAGDALVGEIERWARSIDARVLRLSVAEDNAVASQLYRRHGFEYTGELGDLMPDGNRRERVMEKVVAGRP